MTLQGWMEYFAPNYPHLKYVYVLLLRIVINPKGELPMRHFQLNLRFLNVFVVKLIILFTYNGTLWTFFNL